GAGGDGAEQCGAVGNRSDSEAWAKSIEKFQIRRRTMQGGDIPIAIHQLLDQVETDKSGCSRDQGDAPGAMRHRPPPLPAHPPLAHRSPEPEPAIVQLRSP